MSRAAPIFETRLARTQSDVVAAQRLRYAVFCEELKGDGPLVDHDARLERDQFDAHAEQLVLIDHAHRDGPTIVGVYRFMDAQAARGAGRFYSADEFDLGVLEQAGRPMLELGRSCLHTEYRGGPALLHLWQGLGDVVRTKGAEVLFGMASFHGTDLDALAQPLSLLARDHLAPPELRVVSKGGDVVPSVDQIDRVAAMKQVPALIKAYLRLGGFVGDGVFVDHAFNTTDVCLILDTARMNPRQAALYGGAR